MKNNGWSLKSIVFAAVFAAFSSFGQTPPPNDNYSNSITLTGTDVTFSGTLAGATLESAGNFLEKSAYENQLGMSNATESVWWNWTAPVSTVLTFQVLSSSPAVPISPDGYYLDGLIVYTATNGSATPAGLVLPAVGGQSLQMLLEPVAFSIPVTAGISYQIQLIGSTSASYTFHMIATNAPVIITQPKSQAVYSNASCLFYVLADGLAPTNFTYQWQFNGNPMTNQTAPMLALTNINGTMAGSYSVVVSNSAGFTISQPTTLTVSQSNVPISLSVIGMVSSNFLFSLTGENGRNYRIEYSTDLVHWSRQAGFPMYPPNPPTYWGQTSVIFNSNSPTVLTVAAGPGRKFFRATPYVVNDPVAEICINNLREIRVAKHLWQHYNNASIYSDDPQLSDVIPYFPNRTAPFCPLDDTQTFSNSYYLNAEIVPLCNINGPAGAYDPWTGTHVLADPQ